jgi:hypothetical protein
MICGILRFKGGCCSLLFLKDIGSPSGIMHQPLLNGKSDRRVLMNKMEQQDLALDELIKDLQLFIEFSFQEDESSINDWVRRTVNKIESHCWEINNCDDENCPAYKNEDGRCWLTAGTMCGGKTQRKFVEKYVFCTECHVYQNAIGENRVRKLRELTLALIHSLRSKYTELKEASSKIKIL